MRKRWVVARSPVVPVALFLCAVSLCGEARGEWNYRNGFGYEWSRGELRLNLFLRPRYEFLSDDGLGRSRNTFRVDLAGARIWLETARRRVRLELAGGLAGQRGVLLDSFLQFRIGQDLAIRFGYFRVPFDEQTTHAPFWLRMTSKSIDVAALGQSYDGRDPREGGDLTRALTQGYDLGLELRGSFLDDGLAFAVSMTNGEPLTSLDNMNIDFLYSGRLAVRVGELDNWHGSDLIIGLGTSWNLEPWEPEEGVRVNRSVLAETLDLTLQIGGATITLAGIYRWIDPGAYGPDVHSLGWHFEGGVFVGDQFEFATRFAHLILDLEETGLQQMEAAAVINAFADRNRIRVQLEYAYLVTLNGGERERDAHRVVLLAQALY